MFWTQLVFQTQIFLGPTFFRPIYFGPNIIFDQIFFFKPNFFSDKFSMDPTFFKFKNLFWLKFFDQQFCFQMFILPKNKL